MLPLTLGRALQVLEQIAPLALAAEWDNVGLLVGAPPDRTVSKCLLCIDLTESVLDEALETEAELVLAYHPPIFAPLRRLAGGSPTERIVQRSLANGLAIYSPHTALDAAPGGVNDWLAATFPDATCEALEPAPVRRSPRVVCCAGGRVAADGWRARLGDLKVTETGGHVEIRCEASDLIRVEQVLRATHPSVETEVWVQELAPNVGVGQGRRVTLAEPRPLEWVLEQMKARLGPWPLRVAFSSAHRASDARVETIALCAGAGGSVLSGAREDLLWTGEMRHHDVLAAMAVGSSVVLSEHSHTERGYLAVLAERLRREWGESVKIHCSARDREPLEVF